jgi:hypothetical protein
MKLLYRKLYLYLRLCLLEDCLDWWVIECLLNSRNNVGELSVTHLEEAAEAASKIVLSGIPKIERKIKKL